jgi:hypothetical protein
MDNSRTDVVDTCVGDMTVADFDTLLPGDLCFRHYHSRDLRLR